MFCKSPHSLFNVKIPAAGSKPGFKLFKSIIKTLLRNSISLLTYSCRVLEYWNGGIMEYFVIFHYSNIPFPKAAAKTISTAARSTHPDRAFFCNVYLKYSRAILKSADLVSYCS